MYHDNLAALQRQMRQYQQLKDQERTLQRNIDTMESMLPRLKEEALEEQSDVDNLENGGIVSMLYSAIGRRDEKLAKERAEAQAAQTKYQDALLKCQSLYQDLESVRSQLSSLQDCASAYQRAFREKQQRLLQGSGTNSALLRDLGERAARCNAEQKEIREALDAGDLVLAKISEIEDTLRGASNWGIVDIAGGGVLSDMAKYGHLDQAKRQIDDLNQLLHRYARELKDLDVNLQLSANMGTGMQFADFFFDGFLADAIAYNRINRLRDQVAEVRRRVQYYRDMLMDRQNRNRESINHLKKQAEDLIINA